jgi:hypothetical protein
MKNKIPQRRCVGCREMKDKPSLIRIVYNEESDAKIFFDESGKSNGRGAYICKNANCLRLAHKLKGLERSFKRAVPLEIFEKLNLMFLSKPEK